MYASQRSVNKNSETLNHRKELARKNRLIHKGMMKSHVQVTPDGRVIQHYVMSRRSAQIKKAFVQAMSKAQAENEVTPVVENTADPVNE